MRFVLNPNARKAIEKSVGVSCAELQMKSLSRFRESKSSCKAKVSVRQIKPRGSIYLQLGRMASMDKMKKVIQDF